MALVALLSNPNSTGNRALLPRIRSFCAQYPEIFHYEVEDVSEIGEALTSIARVNPRVLVLNGGDGTVQAALTELYHGGQFGTDLPPLAVLPNGKTNLIALDLGANADPIDVLDRIVAIARDDLESHIVERELISLSEGEQGNRPVMGMFLGGAGLADTILYCREKLYPTGLPNGLCHVIAGIAAVFAMITGLRARFLPPLPNPVTVSLIRNGEGTRRFSFLIVTTLEKLLLTGRAERNGAMGLKLLAVEQSGRTLARAFMAAIAGKLGREPVAGVHVQHGDVIRIESDATSVILDGETFHATRGRPIVLRATAPVHFLKLAA
ncbi:MAG: diacylglycerol kinase family protein [Chakrabartia sp.]